MVDERLTIPDAIRKLFGIDVATECQLLKTKANSLVRNKLIKTKTERIVHRNAVYLAEGQETVLFNALLLNAFFPDTKDVKQIFSDIGFRHQAANIIKSVLIDKQTVIGVAISHANATELIACLEGSFDLYKSQLPNPFQVLPQAAIEGNIPLLQALLAQATTLSHADSVLLHFIKGDIAKAYELAQRIVTDNSDLLALREAVESKYKEAHEFDALLDQFRKM